MPPLRIVQLGLGRMGLPIAHALRDTGFDVAAVDPAVPGVAVSALDLVGSAQVLLTVLPGPPEVEAALAEIKVTGDRYPAQLAALVGR